MRGGRAKLTGPVTGGSRGWPFGSAVEDLSAHGYVEAEYFIEGTATRFRGIGELGADGRWDVEPTTTDAYRTRLLVLRPANEAAFNGTVLLSWNNVSSGHDIVHPSRAVFDGFAYVGVTAQVVGIEGYSPDPHGLRAWDPERYGDLSIPDDAVSYDVFTQAARAIGPQRAVDGIDPMDGLDVRRVIATGGSQSGARLTTYINAIHPGERAIDAFMPLISGGRGSSIDSPDVLDASKLADPAVLQRLMSSFLSGIIRTDLDSPVMFVNSESEVLGYVPTRQPDTDTFRYWEIAGASHAAAPVLEAVRPILERDGLGSPVLTDPPPSAVNSQRANDAAVHHVHEWLVGGTPPPRQPYVDVQGAPASIVRDRFGNAVGGVRLPELEVPIATYSGEPVAAGVAGLGGFTKPLGADELRTLYPTHLDYVSRVERAAEAAVAEGVLLPRDAAAYIDEAKNAAVPPAAD